MGRENGVVDGEERLWSWEDNREGGKVALQSWVDGETSSGGVHGGHVLCVVDLLQIELVPAVPVAIVHVLSDDCVRAHRPVAVDLGHVHVIQEVDQLLASRRAVVFPCLLLQRFLQDLLSHLCAVVEVEGDIGNEVILIKMTQGLVQHEGFSGASQPDQHQGKLALDQKIDEKLHSDCLCVVNKTRLKGYVRVQIELGNPVKIP